jgi:hypothetical protein
MADEYLQDLTKLALYSPSKGWLCIKTNGTSLEFVELTPNKRNGNIKRYSESEISEPYNFYRKETPDIEIIEMYTTFTKRDDLMDH